VIAIEGLDLQQVDAGWYELMCLPAKLGGSDGAPVRCVLHSPQLPGSASGARQDAVQVGEGTATVAAASSTGAAGAAVERPAVVNHPLHCMLHLLKVGRVSDVLISVTKHSRHICNDYHLFCSMWPANVRSFLAKPVVATSAFGRARTDRKFNQVAS
jgi:hypothetical protein